MTIRALTLATLLLTLTVIAAAPAFAESREECEIHALYRYKNCINSSTRTGCERDYSERMRYCRTLK